MHGQPLVIVDDPASPHGQRVARVLRQTTPVIWIPPTLQLPANLLAADATVIALPLRLRGAHIEDPFTTLLLDAITCLGDRGCRVFVAQGSHPNLLARFGIPVTASPDGLHATASEACVAAAEAALLGTNSVRRELHG